MKVNQSREKTAQQIAGVLNNCNMLLCLELEKHCEKYLLNVITDNEQVKYEELTSDGMNWFLSKLKMYVNNKEDIIELLEEMDCLQAV